MSEAQKGLKKGSYLLMVCYAFNAVMEKQLQQEKPRRKGSDDSLKWDKYSWKQHIDGI